MRQGHEALALTDMIGLAEFADSKYRPCLLFKEMVAAGRLGRTTGQGV